MHDISFSYLPKVWKNYFCLVEFEKRNRTHLTSISSVIHLEYNETS